MSEMHAVKTPPPTPEVTPPAEPRRPRPRALTIGTIVLVLAAIVGVLVLALSRRGAEAKERQQRAAVQDSGPVVRLATVELSNAERTLGIPGEVRAWNQATLYSKVAGYVREVLVDKGSRVKKGELLARLESPETDQQVLGARADLQLKTVQAERAAEAPAPGLHRPAGPGQRRGRALGVPRHAPAAARAPGLRAGAGAVRRGGHRPLRRPRGAGRRGHGVEPGGAAALRLRGHADGAGAGLRRPGRRGGHPPRQPGEHRPPGRPRAPHRGQGHPHGAGHRRAHPHHAGRGRRAQRAGAPLPGQLRQREDPLPRKAHAARSRRGARLAGRRASTSRSSTPTTGSGWSASSRARTTGGGCRSSPACREESRWCSTRAPSCPTETASSRSSPRAEARRPDADGTRRARASSVL